MNIYATQLLNEQSELESKLSNVEDVLHSFKKSQIGLVLDSEKNDSYFDAKREFANLFSKLRIVNTKLNKIRKLIGFKAENGRRVTIYKYL